MTIHVPDGVVILGPNQTDLVVRTVLPYPGVDPRIAPGIDAPIGSGLYFGSGIATETLFVKIGALTTDWAALGEGRSILTWGNDSIAASADTRFLYAGRASVTAPLTAITGMVSTRGGQLRSFRVRHNSAVGNGNIVVYDVRINGVAQGLALSLVTGAIGDASDGVSSFAVNAGDVLTVTATKALGIGAGGIGVQFSCELGS